MNEKNIEANNQAAEGEGQAAYWLGRLYADGCVSAHEGRSYRKCNNVRKNPAVALAWFELAREMGHGGAKVEARHLACAIPAEQAGEARELAQKIAAHFAAAADRQWAATQNEWALKRHYVWERYFDREDYDRWSQERWEAEKRKEKLSVSGGASS